MTKLAQASTAERLADLDVARLLALPSRCMVIDLGMPIDREMPQGERGELFPFSMAQSVTPSHDPSAFQVSAEAIVGSLHTSTHLDALCHVLAEGRVFGGEREEDARSDSGWNAHGVETVPPILARFVLADLAELHGVEELAQDHEVGLDEMDRFLSQCSLTVQKGDVVLLRTGKIRGFYRDAESYGRVSPGLSLDAGIELHRRGAALLGSDTPGTERLPFKDPARTLHRAMLAERGVLLIENLNLETLHDAGAQTGLFICLPLRIRGATASWVRPIAVI